MSSLTSDKLFPNDQFRDRTTPTLQHGYVAANIPVATITRIMAVTLHIPSPEHTFDVGVLCADYLKDIR